eukprot:m.73797 g.73797  ORF g.73797 m.73797 type:complete len:191 (-) comp50309_c0_seq4:259-831(-)
MAQPNILITGTPGTGKTNLAAELADRLGFHHINVGALAKAKALHDGFDEEHDALLLNDDKVIDELDDDTSENYVPAGGKIVDHHGCDFFPVRFFQLVVVLRADNTLLWDRLLKRGYSESKIQENVEAEIMQVSLLAPVLLAPISDLSRISIWQVVLDEAHDSYGAEIIMVCSCLFLVCVIVRQVRLLCRS